MAARMGFPRRTSTTLRAARPPPPAAPRHRHPPGPGRSADRGPGGRPTSNRRRAARPAARAHRGRRHRDRQLGGWTPWRPGWSPTSRPSCPPGRPRRAAARARARPDRAAGRRLRRDLDSRRARSPLRSSSTARWLRSRPRMRRPVPPLRRGAGAARARRPGRPGEACRTVTARWSSPSGRGSGARRCRQNPWPTACAPRWRGRCRWANGCGNGRRDYSQDRTPGRPAADLLVRRGGHRDLHRAGRGPGHRPRRACCTGSRPPSPTRGWTSARRRLETLGAEAVDAFYVCDPSGTPRATPDAARSGSTHALVAATGGTRRRESAARRHGRHAGSGSRFCR